MEVDVELDVDDDDVVDVVVVSSGVIVVVVELDVVDVVELVVVGPWVRVNDWPAITSVVERGGAPGLACTV